MAEKGPPAPMPKTGKTKIPIAKQTNAKTNIPLAPKIILRPIDYQQGQKTLYPPNQMAQLPEQPPNLPNPPPPPPIPLHLQDHPNPPPPPPIPLNLPPPPHYTSK